MFYLRSVLLDHFCLDNYEHYLQYLALLIKEVEDTLETVVTLNDIKIILLDKEKTSQAMIWITKAANVTLQFHQYVMHIKDHTVDNSAIGEYVIPEVSVFLFTLPDI